MCFTSSHGSPVKQRIWVRKKSNTEIWLDATFLPTFKAWRICWHTIIIPDCTSQCALSSVLLLTTIMLLAAVTRLSGQHWVHVQKGDSLAVCWRWKTMKNFSESWKNRPDWGWGYTFLLVKHVGMWNISIDRKSGGGLAVFWLSQEVGNTLHTKRDFKKKTD